MPCRFSVTHIFCVTSKPKIVSPVVQAVSISVIDNFSLETPGTMHLT